MPKLERSQGECGIYRGLGTPVVIIEERMVLTMIGYTPTGLDIYQNRSTKPISSNGRCWRRGGSRMRGGGNIRELERPSRRRRRKPSSFVSRPSGTPDHLAGQSPSSIFPTVIHTSCPVFPLLSRQSVLHSDYTWMEACQVGAFLFLEVYTSGSVLVPTEGWRNLKRERLCIGCPSLEQLIHLSYYVRLNYVDSSTRQMPPSGRMHSA